MSDFEFPIIEVQFDVQEFSTFPAIYRPGTLRPTKFWPASKNYFIF